MDKRQNAREREDERGRRGLKLKDKSRLGDREILVRGEGRKRD